MAISTPTSVEFSSSDLDGVKNVLKVINPPSMMRGSNASVTDKVREVSRWLGCCNDLRGVVDDLVSRYRMPERPLLEALLPKISI